MDTTGHENDDTAAGPPPPRDAESEPAETGDARPETAAPVTERDDGSQAGDVTERDDGSEAGDAAETRQPSEDRPPRTLRIGPRRGVPEAPAEGLRAVPLPPGSAAGTRPWWRRLAAAVTVALVVLFLLQFVRLQFPLVAWYLRDTLGAGSTDLVPYGLAPFVLALLAPIWPRVAGPRQTILVGVGLVAALRVVEQVVRSPGADLWLALIAVTIALWVLVPLFSAAQDVFAHGLLLGLAVDTAIRGVAWTLDLSWHDSALATWVVVGLAVALAATTWVTIADRVPRSGPAGGAGLPLVGLGPLLFLELLVLQNQGWAATATDWSWGAAFLLVGVGNVVGLLGVSLGRVLPGQNATGLIGGVLLLLVTVQVGLGGVLFALLFLAAHLGGGLALGALTAPAPPDRITMGTAGHGVSLGVASLVFAVLGLVYYLGYDVPMPVAQDLVPVIAGGLVVLFGLGASVAPRPPTTANWAVVALGVILLAVPLQWARTHDDPVPAASGDGFPVRVATYNLHSAFGTDGVQDLERIAAAMEATGAEVIGLQEVSRGWLIDGSTDMLGWLQRRLDMPYVVFHATTPDPLWGNAIMSRHPLSAVERVELPELDTLIRRGVLAADVDLGAGAVLRFLVTHLHHTGDLETIHAAQVGRLLEVWNRDVRSVVVGDLNAEPGWPQVQQLLDAGFVDAWAEAGDGPGLTANAADPQHRIDWIVHTEDLVADDAEVILSQASDHFAVAATISVAE